MILNKKSIHKYYAGVSPTELKRFQEFLETHTIKRMEIDGRSIPYYSCGKSEKNILTFAGGHSGPQVAYDMVLGFEDEFRIVVFDFSSFKRLEDFSSSVNQILDAEGIDRVIVMGQSLGGIIAQAYFKRNFERIDTLVLINTLAPNKARNKTWGLLLIRILPYFLLKFLFKMKIRKWTPERTEIPPEAEDRIKFKTALINHILDQEVSKKSLVNALRMCFEFNDKDEYRSEELQDWSGRILIVTSEDDPGYKDVDTLMKYLPNAELYSFPKGLRHMAPMVHMHEFQSRVKEFLRKI